MNIETGQTAPAFSLYDTDKNKVSLEDHKGKNVVLLFFPLAFTSVCTAELCSIRDGIGFYTTANATVFGISVDSIYTLAKFKEQEQLNYPLLSDFNKEVSALYGALYENWYYDMKGVSKRAVFVIDKNGILQYSDILESAGDMPDFTPVETILHSFA